MPSVESGDRIYAIGDIHGRFDLLQRILEQIGEHSASLPPSRALHIVFLGDLIDRGPQSAEVIELLYNLERRSDRVIVLLGNHEEAMLQALRGDLGAFRSWLAFGGEETLRSFKVAPRGEREDLRDYLARARSAIPAHWTNWLARLPLSVRSGDYLFVHAGIRPGTPLHRQAREDLLWIRADFLEDPRDHGAVIVHGHSIEPEVAIRDNRIGIDTGAYRTGQLTAIYLEGDRREIISTAPEPVGFTELPSV